MAEPKKGTPTAARWTVCAGGSSRTAACSLSRCGHGTPIAPSTYDEQRDRVIGRVITEDEWRDVLLCNEIHRVWAANYRAYGARKVWLQLNQEGIAVARFTVERLMAAMQIEGARRGGKKRRTTISDPAAVRPADLVQRRFNPARPDRPWVADFT